MAYLIFNNTNSLVKIAANDSDRDSQNIVLSDHTVESISDSDFLKIRTGVATATYDGTSVTLTDNVIVSVSEIDFKKYLENFDSSSLSFPYDKNIEQYCDENSIIFYHPLQIP